MLELIRPEDELSCEEIQGAKFYWSRPSWAERQMVLSVMRGIPRPASRAGSTAPKDGTGAAAAAEGGELSGTGQGQALDPVAGDADGARDGDQRGGDAGGAGEQGPDGGVDEFRLINLSVPVYLKRWEGVGIGGAEVPYEPGLVQQLPYEVVYALAVRMGIVADPAALAAAKKAQGPDARAGSGVDMEQGQDREQAPAPERGRRPRSRGASRSS